MTSQELESHIRVKLEPEQETRLWKKVEERGVTETSEVTGYSRSSIYNWRSKDVFIPLDFVNELVEDPVIEQLKGEGRSRAIRPEEFPIRPGDELLTRVSESVYVNRDGVPFYRTYDFSLLNRFEELLQQMGEIPHQVYERNGFYELRYPKFLHEIFQLQDFEEDIGAQVDESGEIRDKEIVVGGRSLEIGGFDEKLHSLRKRERLARVRGDSEELERIIRLQVSKANELF